MSLFLPLSLISIDIASGEDFKKIKNFCASKDTIKKVKEIKTNPYNETKFVNHIFDKGLLFRIKNPEQFSY